MPTTLYRRALGRGSSHRQAMLRNLVTSLFTHEAITTTWPRAKETQRLADKVITLAKRNTEVSRRKAEAQLWHPTRLIPTIFGPLRKRYENREGGYTRVLRMGLRDYDKADIAMISLVDGPRDMRFWMTAAAVANQISLQKGETLSSVIDEVMAPKSSSSSSSLASTPSSQVAESEDLLEEEDFYDENVSISGLTELTCKNIRKSLQLRGKDGKKEFIETVKLLKRPGKPLA